MWDATKTKIINFQPNHPRKKTLLYHHVKLAKWFARLCNLTSEPWIRKEAASIWPWRQLAVTVCDEWRTHVGVLLRVQPVALRVNLKPGSQTARLFPSRLPLQPTWDGRPGPNDAGVIFSFCAAPHCRHVQGLAQTNLIFSKRQNSPNRPWRVWEASRATVTAWKQRSPVLLALGTRTSTMAAMMVLFPLRLLTRSIIRSVISLMGLRSKQWSSVDWKSQEEEFRFKFSIHRVYLPSTDNKQQA